MSSAASPLHQAIHALNVAEVERLLAEGADPDALDDRGEPPLHAVIPFTIGFTFEPEMGRIIALLAEAGADFGLKKVSERLKLEARDMVSSALEANMAGEFIAALEVAEAGQRPRKARRRGR
jgi:hypothetical protein